MGRWVVGSLVVVAGCFSDGGPQGTSEGSSSGGASSGVGPAVCGDAVVEPPEECDEGGANGTVGSSCHADCRSNTCGDGIAVSGLEECDEGEFNGTGGACTPACALDVCGDGYVGPDEGCDDGNLDSGDGCEADCRLPGCGDGVVQQGEACDDGNPIDTDACTSLCKLPRCGDGVVQEGEACDDGDRDPHDACTATCAVAMCGDGVLQVGVEQCDDGNTVEGDHCSSTCSLLKLYVFATSVRYPGDLGGLVGADAKCQALADTAGVQGVFRAWLSDTTATPASRFDHGLPYTRLDKVPVADSLDAMLQDASLLAPIQITDSGALLPPSDGCADMGALVWTNLTAEGNTVSSTDCAKWTDAGGSPPLGGIGVVDAIDKTWTNSACPTLCGALLRLYCFQQLI